MNEEKSIVEVKKYSFVNKIINFFKSLSFKSKKQVDIITNVETKENKQKQFQDIVSNQKKFRSGEISANDFTYEQISNMINLYKVQIEKLNKENEEKLKKIQEYKLKLDTEEE